MVRSRFDLAKSFRVFRRGQLRAPRVAAVLACIGLLAALYCKPGADRSGDEAFALAPLLLQSGGADGDLNQPGAVTVPAGDPPAPGEPQIAPTLQPLTLATFDANPADDPGGVRGLIFVQNVGFTEPVHSGTAVTAFLGRRNMTLQPDGTVLNALKHYTRNASAPISFSFLAEADRRYKILVVARNQFGLSAQEVMRGHARVCADAQPAPATLGDCADYCLRFEKTGDLLHPAARFVAAESMTSIHLSVRALHPRGVLPSVAYNAFQSSGTSPAGEYNALVSVAASEYAIAQDFLCLRSESQLSAQTSAGGLVFRALQWRVLTPDN